MIDVSFGASATPRQVGAYLASTFVPRIDIVARTFAMECYREDGEYGPESYYPHDGPICKFDLFLWRQFVDEKGDRHLRDCEYDDQENVAGIVELWSC